MITDGRLKEIETEGRSAAPFKAELQEMAAAYRNRTTGLRVTKSDGQVWLHFDAPSGRKAAISLDVLSNGRGALVSQALSEWANSLPDPSPASTLLA